METLGDKVEELLDIDGIKVDKEGVVHADTIEVGGVKITQVQNRAGRVWAVPADDANVDRNEGGLRNILQIPDPEPGFFYQYVRDDQLGDYLSRDFALVEPKDVGLPDRSIDPTIAGNIGARPASHHQVGNNHLVMIPEGLERRYRRAEKMRADEATAGIMVPRHLGKAVKQIADTDVEVHSRETKTVTGESFVASNPGFKEYPSEEK